jgi:hypothetical protein
LRGNRPLAEEARGTANYLGRARAEVRRPGEARFQTPKPTGSRSGMRSSQQRPHGTALLCVYSLGARGTAHGRAPIGEAFDQASARIKRIFCNDPDAVEASRIRLAEAILSVATEGNTDVEDLKNRAIVELAQHYSSPVMRK